MKNPVTYTASVNDGILSVSFSRKPRLSVRENIRGAGLKYDAASTAWTGKPENPASVLEMLRETLGKPSSVTVSVDPEELPEAAPENGSLTEETMKELAPLLEKLEAAALRDIESGLVETIPDPETLRFPTYEEARAELERFTAAKKAAEDARDEACRRHDEISDSLYRYEDGRRKLRADLTEEETTAVSEALAPIEAERAAAYAEIDRLSLCIRYAAQNRDRAFFDKYGPAAAEVFNRYSGKPFGPKTSAKITAEIEEKTGISVRFWRHAQYSSDSVTFRIPGENYSLDGFPRNLFDQDGKINRFDLSDVSAELSPPYILDVTARVAEAENLRREIGEAKSALDSLCAKYNGILPAGDRGDRIYCSLR